MSSDVFGTKSLWVVHILHIAQCKKTEWTHVIYIVFIWAALIIEKYFRFSQHMYLITYFTIDSTCLDSSPYNFAPNVKICTFWKRNRSAIHNNDWSFLKTSVRKYKKHSTSISLSRWIHIFRGRCRWARSRHSSPLHPRLWCSDECGDQSITMLYA